MGLHEVKGWRAAGWAGAAVLLLVCSAMLWARAVAGEEAPYGFMEGSRQDGFFSYVMNGDAIVDRFYFVGEDYEAVVKEARSELGLHGWTERDMSQEAWAKGSRATTFYREGASVLIEPMSVFSGATSVVVTADAAFLEEILGTVYESIPDRYSELRR